MGFCVYLNFIVVKMRRSNAGYWLPERVHKSKKVVKAVVDVDVEFQFLRHVQALACITLSAKLQANAPPQQ